MDIFRNADLDELNNALGDARADEAVKAELQDEQDKKDDKFNDIVKGFTDPLTAEFLRRPVEGAVKAASKAVRTRVAGGVKSAAEKAKSFAQQKLSDAADRFGVNSEDLDSLRSGFQQTRAARFAPDRTGSTGRATSAVPEGVDDETRGVINTQRAVDGQSPLKATPTEGGEPVEVDAFTGKPVVRQAPEPQPFTESDDWTADLYDSPISHVNPVSSVPNPVKKPLFDIEPPEGANPTERFASSRLQSIFKGTDTSSLPTPTFKPQPVQAPEAAAGDTEPLDQLHPLRELFNTNPEKAAQNKSILQAFKNTDGDLTTGAGAPTPQQVQLQGQQPPPDAKPAQISGEPTPSDPSNPPTSSGAGADSEADAGSSLGKEAEQESEKVLTKTAKTGIKDAGEDALSSFAEGEAIGGGPEDPLADILGGVMAIGSELGSIFGQHHTKAVSDAPAVNAGVQQGVY